MRRLTNNWLYGAVSPLLSGRVDSDIYGNSCAELLNMKVHRQGGISRRPPVKGKRFADGFCRIIPFIVDKTHVLSVLFGAGRLGVYDYLNNSLSDNLALPTHAVAIHSWANITANQCKEIRYAQYFNDIYFVHPDFPLMRIRYSAGTYMVSTPQVFVNQDITPHSVDVNITMTGTSASENLTFVFDGVPHSFSIPITSNPKTITDAIMSFDYPGFTLEQSSDGSSITFTPDDTIGKYIQYMINDPDYFRLSKNNGEEAQTCVAVFSFGEIPEGLVGEVYGSDDFLPCYLNRQDPAGKYEFASSIAIVSEKMFLAVNGDPCNIYISRPYGTSQIVYPKRSNDTILDFVQFHMVASETKVMKEESNLPIMISEDTDGYKIYEGVSTAQKLWLPPPENQIKTKEDLSEWRNGYYINGSYVANSAHELKVVYDPQNPVIVSKLRKITTTETTEEDFIERKVVFFLTYDANIDMSKMSYDYTTHEYSARRYNPTTGDYETTYRTKSGSLYPQATVTDSGTGGIKNVYTPTKDTYVNSKTAYYTRSGSGTEHDPYVYTFVDDPQYSSLRTYYEKSVEFTNLDSIPIYEQGPQYVYSDNDEQLRVAYLDNGMIGALMYEDSVVVEAIPLYQYDMTVESEIYETDTEVDKVATASTGMEFQLARGRNDRISWMLLGDYLIIGTESSENRVKPTINAKEQEVSAYSFYGSNRGLAVNMGADIIFLQNGNALRMMYTDDYGLQNMELSLVNPEIMQGTVNELVAMNAPEPSIYSLKDDGSVVCLCIDRANGVQAFSEWTFTSEKPISFCVLENGSRQVLVALMSDGIRTYIGEFDTTEKEVFADCALVVDDGITVIQDNVREYTSRMTANPFDSVMQDGSVTLGLAKNVSKMIFRCLDTGHIRTYFNPKDKTVTRTPVCCDIDGTYEEGLADHSVNVNGGTTRDLMITVESVDDEPMTLLAMAYELRLNRNGA